MISRIYWPNKRTDQRLDYGHDFGSQIGEATDALDTGTLEAQVIEGDVAIVGSAQIAVDNDQEVVVTLDGGTHQTLNKIRIRATTVGGRKVSVVALLRVRDQ